MKRTSRNATLGMIFLVMTISCKTPSTANVQADAAANQDASTSYKCGRPLVEAWDARNKTKGKYECSDQTSWSHDRR